MELLLEKQELLDLGENLHGVRIVCREGRCWITQTGDSRDHLLGTGGSFNVYSKGHLIITATETCRLMLSDYGLQDKTFFAWRTHKTIVSS